MGIEKVIHDPIHGSVKMDEAMLELVDRPEMQRLRGIRQLGLGSLVFPGANHTRFEHSIGVHHLSKRISNSIGLSKEDAEAIKVAGLLHDICHTPFSHATERFFKERTGFDHMDMVGPLMREGIPGSGLDPISETLESRGISVEMIGDLIKNPVSRTDPGGYFQDSPSMSHFPSKDYMHQILHGPVDADQMDYLMRDAHYTGVAHGRIDLDRILDTMMVHNDRIMIDRGGVPAVEGLMISRSLMFTSIYYHTTNRIANMMLTKALESSDQEFEGIHCMDDADLSAMMMEEDGTPSRIMGRIKRRDLYKKAALHYNDGISDDARAILANCSDYNGRMQLEREIADRAGVDPSEVALDTPPRSALLSEMIIGKTDVSIFDDNKVKSLTKLSSVAKALQSRDVFGWSLLISTPNEHVDGVAKASKKVLNL